MIGLFVKFELYFIVICHGIHLDKSKNFCELYCRDESLIMSEVHSKRR